VQRDHVELAAIASERVEVAIAQTAPVVKLDAQLERTLRGADEVVLVDSQRFVERADRRDGGLADADRADVVALDQGDPAAGLERIRQRSGSHPPGSTSPDDDDAANGLGIGHGVFRFRRVAV
jgi:hypothetical protein